ncbi:hypothetical protein DFA_05050 [Cavenderia fasciculata]|uniref:Uncharacterized protein n=1 Tax=Cavenderia fasciculata TaxID=261658 RepID=F4PN67_CACFS|nr:uncharacterized protein DFA_05050 [Cavenderia fasciculata]EGG22920.1 hypothetical protein DFA_05050 [Cavenderia fasciculata]|eukprot:XP_004360771.1 hypothetical protein DFA_05050 [Cavenderia fasciculata]
MVSYNIMTKDQSVSKSTIFHESIIFANAPTSILQQWIYTTEYIATCSHSPAIQHDGRWRNESTTTANGPNGSNESNEPNESNGWNGWNEPTADGRRRWLQQPTADGWIGWQRPKYDDAAIL